MSVSNDPRELYREAPEDDRLIPPAEFVRMRYFFGQRLGVVDLADEQAYIVGKQRFHNLRAHGAGVLCGLSAERYLFPQGSAPAVRTTSLRVRRGAALDWFGREIIVGWDQCIDVAAWLTRHKEAQKAAASTLGEPRLRLWVAICYRECPSDPAPAPRDPCGCDADGCEFARVREGFELKLLIDDEKRILVPREQDPFDEPVAEEILAGSLEDSYEGALARFTGAACSEAHPDLCLLLAFFWAKLDTARKTIIDLDPPDNAIPERRSLLPTAVLQDGILRALAAANDAELLGTGPRFAQVTFAHGAAIGSGTLAIDLSAGLSRDPCLTPNPQLALSVWQFEDTGDWKEAPNFTCKCDPPHNRIEVIWTASLTEGRYRVLIEADRKQPPVDAKMKPLTPLSWARHFRLNKDGAQNLQLAASLY
jgi:hypothetical protein